MVTSHVANRAMQRAPSRRGFCVLAGSAIAGCARLGGSDATPTVSDNPAMADATQLGDLELTSPAFDDGDPIPRQYGHDEQNVNPPLRISFVPDEAAALVLIMDDPDAVEPAGTVWLHWLVWNIDPRIEDIPEGWDAGDAVEGTNDFGERGYGGPAPPDREHTYRFKLYAIDRELDLPESASKADVGDAMEGHVLARTQLEGTYAP